MRMRMRESRNITQHSVDNHQIDKYAPGNEIHE